MTSIKDIFILTILTILEIACSQLTSNPNDCGCLFTWQNDKLSANCSSRTSINYQCVAEKNPHKLDISKNNLEEFPEEFINNPFPNLEDVNAAQNKIEHVPKDLKHLFPNLKNVNLADNCLSDPTEVLNLKDVTCVLDNNPFICNCTDPSTQLLLRHAHVRKLLFIVVSNIIIIYNLILLIIYRIINLNCLAN